MGERREMKGRGEGPGEDQRVTEMVGRSLFVSAKFYVTSGEILNYPCWHIW